MPGKRPQTYQYQEGDDPVKIASQFGITPQELLASNPGGAPFSVGQTINVPFAYAPAVAQHQQAVQQANTWSKGVSNFVSGFGTPAPISNPNPPGSFNAAIGELVGPSQSYSMYGPNRGSFSYANPYAYGTDDSWYRTTAQTQAARQAEIRIQNGTMNPPASGALGEGDFYGYQRDPETGRSVRVVKNSSTSNFLSELRWDPQRKKYVSIGTLLKQGKLDLKGNWHKRGRRQRQMDSIAKKKTPEQTQQDFTLSNSLISFSASSG